MTRFFSILALSLSLALPAVAHSPVKSTAPADGEIVASAPETISLVFGKPVMLTKVRLETGGQTIDLNLASAKGFGREFALPAGSEMSGPCTVEWRALAEDGHVMNGSFSFNVE
ncbi:MAG: copper resistance CopC family protein [Pseudomonadota bacterium]